MDFYKVPIGFGVALAQNEAATHNWTQGKRTTFSIAHTMSAMKRECIPSWQILQTAQCKGSMRCPFFAFLPSYDIINKCGTCGCQFNGSAYWNYLTSVSFDGRSRSRYSMLLLAIYTDRFEDREQILLDV